MLIADKLLKQLGNNAKIADFGCGNGDTLVSFIDHSKTYHLFGFDKISPANPMIYFQSLELNEPFSAIPDNYFDLSISQHVIEHLSNPLGYFSEMVRVTKPDGYIYIEAPSDRSTWFSYPNSQHLNLILSFYDDPTHTGRPWTPQSFYRLGLYHGLEVIDAKYNQELKSLLKLPVSFLKWQLNKDSDKFVDEYWKAIGWACHAVFKKTANSHYDINYFSLKDKPHGKPFKNSVL